MSQLLWGRIAIIHLESALFLCAVVNSPKSCDFVYPCDLKLITTVVTSVSPMTLCPHRRDQSS